MQIDPTNPIVVNINIIVTFLSALVGVVIVGSLIWGGIQYATAGSDVAGSGKPSQVAAAKQRITNSLIALLAYLLIFAFLQWLIPGGIFDNSGSSTTTPPPSSGPPEPPCTSPPCAR